MKKHNFYAGPSILPEFTEDQVVKAIEVVHDEYQTLVGVFE